MLQLVRKQKTFGVKRNFEAVAVTSHEQDTEFSLVKAKSNTQTHEWKRNFSSLLIRQLARLVTRCQFSYVENVLTA